MQYLSQTTHFKTVSFYCELGLVGSLQVSDIAFEVLGIDHCKEI